MIKRKDTKFISHIRKLPLFLESLPLNTKVLTINRVNDFSYTSEYFDTKEMALYLSHHNQRKNRLKVRIRHYLDTNTRFLEIKKKDNKGTTTKTRLNINGYNEKEYVHDRIREIEKLRDKKLEKKLFSKFDRITLVSDDRSERLTIDRNLSFVSADNKQAEFKNLVVFELKQGHINRHSAFLSNLKKLKIRSRSFSKYCLGVSDLFDIKQNRFIQQRREITKIENYA